MDTTSWARQLQGFAKDVIPYAASYALNGVLFQARDALRDEAKRVFDRPVDFSVRNAFGYTRPGTPSAAPSSSPPSSTPRQSGSGPSGPRRPARGAGACARSTTCPPPACSWRPTGRRSTDGPPFDFHGIVRRAYEDLPIRFDEAVRQRLGRILSDRGLSAR